MTSNANPARPVLNEFVRGGSCLGVVAALYWAVKHPEKPRSCPSHEPARLVVQHCVDPAISAVGIHWMLVLGLGLGLGAAAGLALAMVLGTAGRPRSPDRVAASSGGALAAPPLRSAPAH